MNIGVCAAALSCSAALAAGLAGTQVVSGDRDAGQFQEIFGPPVELLLPGQTPEQIEAAEAAARCDTIDFLECHKAPESATAMAGEVYALPAPTGDPAKDLATLQAAVKNKRYGVIDGAAGGKRQVYTIRGMLEINRTLAIRNLELKQLDDDKVVRTIYAAGGGTPITLRLENIKIERGPKDSEATGSVSDSAGIWTTDVTPEFRNIEITGGGKGDGIIVVNSTGGYLTDIYVHDITWTPYAEDQADPEFWKNYTLATLQRKGDWNGFTITDFDGRTMAKKRVEEQIYGIVLANVTNLDVIRPRIERLLTRFSDGMLYPYQSDGITVNSGNDIRIVDAKITHVAEGIDVPGFPANGIEISGAMVSDAPLFCFKTRGSYDSRSVAVKEEDAHVTVRDSTGTRCGMAAYSVGAGAQAWLEDTQAIDTGLGPGGTAAPGIGTVAAYRFFRSTSLPNLQAGSSTMGMRITGATVSNPNSTVMKAAFHSENDPKDRRTFAMASNFALNNPARADVEVARNFTVVDAGAGTGARARVVTQPEAVAKPTEVAANP
ncbi:MAG: hypothetical protein B7Y99_01665 [Caulobacterales bacterium 32-69-10]|nr:MAG: hypothetical protein B7Y99_01665 [Caulobacterales bacterium 32-69-10]